MQIHIDPFYDAIHDLEILQKVVHVPFNIIVEADFDWARTSFKHVQSCADVPNKELNIAQVPHGLKYENSTQLPHNLLFLDLI